MKNNKEIGPDISLTMCARTRRVRSGYHRLLLKYSYQKSISKEYHTQIRLQL